MRRATIGLIVAWGLLSGSGAQAQSFHGYPCEGDCSSNQAGYNWAEQNGVTDPSSCGGDSQGFVDGCQAWAEEQEDSAAPDENGGDDLGAAPEEGPLPGDEADQPPLDDGEVDPGDAGGDAPEVYQEPDGGPPDPDADTQDGEPDASE